MMKFKALAAVALVTFSAGAFALVAAPVTSTPLTLKLDSLGSYSTSFAGSLATNTYTLDLTNFTGNNVLAVVSAGSVNGTGYDITSATLDGVGFFPYSNSSSSIPFVGTATQDLWYTAVGNLSSSVHTIVVTGTGLGSFGGGLTLAATPIPAVPEPETYAMLLAGLGLMGSIAMRRKDKQA